MLAAATAWDGSAAELNSAAASYRSVVFGLICLLGRHTTVDSKHRRAAKPRPDLAFRDHIPPEER
jgi:hypothetical protein